MFTIPESSLQEPGPSRAVLRVAGLPPADLAAEVRLRFEFDTVPPSDVRLHLRVADGPVISLPVERRGPAIWRVAWAKERPPPEPPATQDVELSWYAPASGARLVEGRWVASDDVDRPEDFFDDFRSVLGLHSGAGALEHCRRFFLELDFVTRLMMDNYLKVANEQAAIQFIGIPASVFHCQPTNVELDVKNIVVNRPFARAHAAIREGTTTLLDGQSVTNDTVVEGIGQIFLTLVPKHFGHDSDAWCEAGLAFMRFANGSLRRRPRSAEITESESTRAFNCEPDGLNFLAFAEFAAEACRIHGSAGARENTELERCWKTLWRAMVSGIEVFGDVYWSRRQARRASAYVPEAYVGRRAWSLDELRCLLCRTKNMDSDDLRQYWGRTLMSLLLDDPRLERPQGS